MRDMTKGNPLRLILSFALPLMLGNLFQQLYNVADTAIVGRSLGAGSLAAVGATSSVQFLILGFCIGTCTGFCIPIAQRFGAKDYKGLRAFIYNSVILTGIEAVVFTVGCVLLTPQILHVLRAGEDIWQEAYVYILIIFLGIPFTLIYNLSAGILRAIGDSRTPFLVLAVSTLVNIVLDLFCILVLGLGVAGAALATISSQALSGIICTWVILSRYEVLHIRKEERVINKRLVSTLLFMGLPMGFQFSITAIGSMVMQSANNGLGSLYTSAFTAASRIKMLAMSPFDAVASSVATFCSQNMGAGDYTRIKKGHYIGNAAACFYGAAAGLLLFGFGRSACMVFVSAGEVEILDAAGLLLRYNGLFFVVLGLLNVNRIVVQGLGFSGRAVFSGVMEMIARCFIALYLVPRMGFTAICLGDPVAWIMADAYILPTCLYALGKVRQMLKGEEGTMSKKVLHRQRKKVQVAGA